MAPTTPFASAPLPDASADNWVDRHAPLFARPWLKLGRLDRPAGAWLLLLPGWQGAALAAAMAGRAPDGWLLVKIAAGAMVMRAAGCAYNDIVDQEIDAKVARTARRPLPSGQVTTRGAWLFLALCSLTGLAILLTLNLAAVGLGVLSLGLVAAYPFMKRITWWPQAWLGLTFNWGALLGFSAATAGADAWMALYGQWMVLTHHWLTFVTAPGRPPGIAAGLLYASGLFWTLGYDTIYAVQDLEDDALAGVKSSARRLGAFAPKGVMGFYAAACGLALLIGPVAHLGFLFYPVLAAFALHLLWQAQDLKVNDPAGALRLFRSNRTAGLLMTAALALGAIHFVHVVSPRGSASASRAIVPSLKTGAPLGGPAHLDREAIQAHGQLQAMRIEGGGVAPRSDSLFFPDEADEAFPSLLMASSLARRPALSLHRRRRCDVRRLAEPRDDDLCDRPDRTRRSGQAIVMHNAARDANLQPDGGLWARVLRLAAAGSSRGDDAVGKAGLRLARRDQRSFSAPVG